MHNTGIWKGDDLASGKLRSRHIYSDLALFKAKISTTVFGRFLIGFRETDSIFDPKIVSMVIFAIF